MRNRFVRINSVLHFIGTLLINFGIIILIPVIMSFVFWGKYGEGWQTVVAFIYPSILSFSLGFLLKYSFKHGKMDITGSMLICSLSWIVFSAIGAIPFVMITNVSYLDGYFEAMSGLSTTGITIFDNLDFMSRSILFWRALCQWLGGLGILSLFLIVVFSSGGAHHIFGAESHKIVSNRPKPGMFSTVKILWGIYLLLTGLAGLLFFIEGMTIFDAICHALTTTGTGGFSTHSSSTAYFQEAGYQNYKLIEYTMTLFMLLGGINFLIHYRILTKDIGALWDSEEIRVFWKLILGFSLLIMINHIWQNDFFFVLIKSRNLHDIFVKLESIFRHTIFQVISIITSSGFITKDINSSYFPAMAKQLFLIMMLIGGCVGSTSGGFKVLRIVILRKLMCRELYKMTVSSKARTPLIIDGAILPNDEVYRAGALFFFWLFLIFIGGAITAALTHQSAWQSFSGMFSVMGNIGPCYISNQDLININPIVKVVYIFGMLAGRLEILPVILLFKRKAWA